MGIQHTCFYEVAPDPTLQCAQEGAEQMSAFRAGYDHRARRWFRNGCC